MGHFVNNLIWFGLYYLGLTSLVCARFRGVYEMILMGYNPWAVSRGLLWVITCRDSGVRILTCVTVDGEFWSNWPWVYLRCWHQFYILSIGTNPLDITSSFVHVGFGVSCLCGNLALNARLPGKFHQAAHEKIMKHITSQAMKWTWLQEVQRPICERRKLGGPGQKMLKLARQGALSKPRRKWRQGPTCRRENDPEDMRSMHDKGGCEVDQGRPAQPISGTIRHPFWPRWS
jgi:hypothetical protein